LAVALLAGWVGVFLCRPGLHAEGGYDGNAPWRDQVPRGIRMAGDTPRYVHGAENLLAGEPWEEKEGSYVGYVVLVAACLRTGAGLYGVVAFQILVAFLALPCLYGLGRRVGGPGTGALAVLLHAANPDPAVWHTFILTDSLYASSLIVFVWLYVEAWDRGWWWRVSVVPATVVLASIRPNGWIVPVALGVHAILTAGRWSWRLRLACLTGLGVLGLATVVGLSGVRHGLEAEHPIQMLYQGEVVWRSAPWRLQMPAPETTDEDWLAAGVYILRHPVACARLAAARMGALFGRVRPAHSLKHNLLVLCIYPPLYLLAIPGLRGAWRRREAQILLAVIAGHVLTVMLTFDDQNGRFFLYFWPELLVFSAAGAAGLLRSTSAAELGEGGASPGSGDTGGPGAGRRRKTT